MSEPWVIQKNGAFYRPDRAGYTNYIAAAGIYTREEAEAEERGEPHSITAIPLSKFRAELVRNFEMAKTRLELLDADIDGDMASIGRALMNALPKGYSYNNCPSEIVADLQNERDDARYALFMCASHCQGGHSDAGKVAADVLGVAFPLTMPNLEAKAKAMGLDPNELWPWLAPMRASNAPESV